jgi:uncharacterized protein with NAD-binding domain and iron-sulfur cluster
VLYVDRGGDPVLRHPYLQTGARLRGFALRADPARLQAICDRDLNQPSGGRLRYRPLCGTVVLTFTTIARLSSLDPRDRNAGYSDETDVAFWFPMACERGGGLDVSWYVPYIFVDRAYAIAAGRELYGFPKSMGVLGIPPEVTSAEPYTVDALVLTRLSPDTRATTQRLLEVSRRERAVESPGLLDHAGFMRRMLSLFSDRGERGAEANAAHLASLLSRREVPITFLRQLRDVEDPARAAYQEILVAPARIAGVRGGGVLPGTFDLRLAAHESHPVAGELGLRRGRNEVEAAFWVDFDFVMDKGRTLWRAGAPAVAPPATVPAARPAPKKVAILGGGIGSLAAAFELTSRPGWQDEYEVTVYQMGWRLGGKGASGRSASAAQRIEEHGLHVWFGFYENAFRVMRQAYEELGRPPGTPLATWRDAFEPHSLVVLQEQVEGEWRPWRMEFPTNHALPGDGGPSSVASDWVRGLIGWIGSTIQLMVQTGAPDASPFEAVLGQAAATSVAALCQVAERALRVGRAGWDRLFAPDAELTAEGVEDARRTLRSFIERRVEQRDDLRRAWIQIDFGLANLIGILRDRVLQRGFPCIDHLDYANWLRSHGASETTVTSAPVRALYDLAFAFEGGDVRRPNFAAGTCLQGVLRGLFTFKGAIMWKMQAGMGDVVFTPLHQVLERRGVKFEFFHRVRHLGLSADGQSVAAIHVDRQATVKDGAYRPLVRVEGVDCWPSEPLTDQLVEGEALRARGVDLEASWADWPAVERRVLAAGQDFDVVVLGIPLGALPAICGELIEELPAWHKMVERVKTTPTLAFQLWTKPDLAALGWRDPSGGSEAPIQGAYVEPVDTWADMSHLLPREAWPAHERPGHLAYFCGPLDDRATGPVDGAFARAERARVERLAKEFLERDAPRLWPAATRDGRFDWGVLHDPQERAGAERFAAQYHRANVEPTERYVLSLAGSTRYRLKTDGSGLRNLFLTGDWVDTGFDCGCIEAAVMAGLQCARALTGRPQSIHGEVTRPPADLFDSYYVLADCPDCRVAGAVLEHVDGRLSLSVESTCRLCGRRTEGGRAVRRGTRPDGAAQALQMLRAFAAREGSAELPAFTRDNFCGLTPEAISQALVAGRPVQTSFSRTSWLLCDEGATSVLPASDDEREDAAVITARALVTLKLADGPVTPEERAFVDRFLATANHAPMRPADLRPWSPVELGRPERPVEILEAMVALAHADGERNEAEWRVIEQYARAWAVPLGHLSEIDRSLARGYTATMRRLWLSLRRVIVA